MYLELDHLKKHFDGREVVRDLSLTLEQGQLLCILGASGCGKTTTLNMIGGFLEPDSGRVRLDGEDITRIPPEQRPVTTVFQSTHDSASECDLRPEIPGSEAGAGPAEGDALS